MNKYAGDVDVQLGADPPVFYRLRVDWNSLASFQAVAGKPWISYIARFQEIEQLAPDAAGLRIMELIGPLELRAMLWSSLLHGLPKITLAQAGELMGQAPGDGFAQKYVYMFCKVMEAWSHQLPPDQKKKLQTTLALLASSNTAMPSGTSTGGVSSSSEPSTESTLATSGA